jgi:predicted GNAT family acetyltransferase
MIRVEPISGDRWPDLEDLFGPERGANSGCWCMWPRLPRSEWKATPRDKRKAAFKRLVKKGPPPGLLAYEDDVAIGWCAVGPRRSVGSFDASRVSKPVDEDADRDKTYAITCFYVRSGHRKKGLMETLARAAAEFARERGAKSVEVCAIDTGRKLMWGEGFVGLAGVFRKLNYKEIARRTPTRPLMRLKLD